MKGICLASVLSIPEGEERCKSAMETLSLFSAKPQLFKCKAKLEDLVNISTNENRTEIPRARMTKKGPGGLETNVAGS